SRQDRAGRGLDQGRNIVDRKLDRDVIEAPPQAKPDGERDREGVERARRWGLCHFDYVLAMGSDAGVHHRSRQCEQMPAISMSGLFGRKPAARDEAFSASAALPPGASPTAPQRSQIKNTTRSSSP